jgi:undecaprenyl-diphosphatase
MSIAEAAVLGAVQGLTEFVPISSSGHLVVVPEALGWDQPGLAFDVLLHAASLVALLAYFGRDLIGLAVGVRRRDRRALRMVILLLVGSVPAGIAGLTLEGFFEEQFSDAPAAALQLLITAVILVAGEFALQKHARRRPQLRVEDELRPVESAGIGVAQAVSILPGISRSGATIATGLGLGLARDAAARFSFLLSIPALAGATLVELPDLAGTSLSASAGIAGFITSLVTSYAAIWGLIRYLRSRTLYPFAIYCVVAGLVFYALVI